MEAVRGDRANEADAQHLDDIIIEVDLIVHGVGEAAYLVLLEDINAACAVCYNSRAGLRRVALRLILTKRLGEIDREIAGAVFRAHLHEIGGAAEDETLLGCAVAYVGETVLPSGVFLILGAVVVDGVVAFLIGNHSFEEAARSIVGADKNLIYGDVVRAHLDDKAVGLALQLAEDTELRVVAHGTEAESIVGGRD